MTFGSDMEIEPLIIWLRQRLAQQGQVIVRLGRSAGLGLDPGAESGMLGLSTEN
jgi:hypothetical protein